MYNSLHEVEISLLWSDDLEIGKQVVFILTFYPKYHNKQSFVIILL